jgi:predicted dehydrogenase
VAPARASAHSFIGKFEWRLGILNIHLISQQRVLRAGVVGAGVFGTHHAAKYLALPGVQLAAIADPSLKARAGIAARHQVPVVADWRELLGKVDCVSVCSPASTHAEIVYSFLAAGAHVLVEKPIATDLDEAEELIALAAFKGRVLTVGHQERFVFAKSGLLDYDETPLSVECVRAGPWTGRGTDVSVVLDLMIHDLDLVHQLVPGALADVRADARILHGGFSDEVNAELTFDNGAEVRLFASRSHDTRKRSMRVVYPDGAIEVDFLTRQVTNTTGRVLHPLDLSDPLAESVGAFITAARAGARSLVRPEEARRALETALQIEDAAAPGTVRPAETRPALCVGA